MRYEVRYEYRDSIARARARSFTSRKQSGRILMDCTCRHRLLRDHGAPISPIIVYARCVNIVFYLWLDSARIGDGARADWPRLR